MSMAVQIGLRSAFAQDWAGKIKAAIAELKKLRPFPTPRATLGFRRASYILSKKTLLERC
jgi:hypothetical protein